MNDGEKLHFLCENAKKKMHFPYQEWREKSCIFYIELYLKI